MSKKKRDAYFWTSYSDLMTSLFFVMLVLFILTITLLHKRIVASEREREATQEQLAKIKEIEESINRIDSNYFEYNDTHKKHILKIDVKFPVGISNMQSIDINTRNELYKAGQAIENSLRELNIEYPEIKYLLIIEGQASKDYYSHNYELSYERALALNRFWLYSKLDFGKNCETIISGSGIGGTMRDVVESKNQRFLIHLIPKPGVIEASK